MRLEQAAQRKREQISRIEGYIYEVQSRPPVRPGPLMYEIIGKRETKVASLSIKRDAIAQSLWDIEAKINEVRRQL
jgi:hypothetical protein